jgi:retinol dehydrogenase 12
VRVLQMSGRVCLVTGATRGIGFATAKTLATLGATVIVHGRDRKRVDMACRKIGESFPHATVSGIVADLSALAEVRRLAGEVLADYDRLDVLINNAGGVTRRRRTTSDGFEWQLAVNHLAPFLLTNLLLARLKANGSARIVTVSSAAHRRGALDFDDLSWERRKYNGIQAYSDSKLANILFTRELSRRLEDTDVTANCLHPGLVATRIFAGMGVLGAVYGVVAKPLMLSASAGARTSIYLATSPEVAHVSGRFFDRCRPVDPAPSAQDSAAARRLWHVSAALVGLAGSNRP